MRIITDFLIKKVKVIDLLISLGSKSKINSINIMTTHV